MDEDIVGHDASSTTNVSSAAVNAEAVEALKTYKQRDSTKGEFILMNMSLYR